AGDLHRPLVRLGAAHREHRVREVAGSEGGELRRQLGGGRVRELARGGIVGEAHRLLGDGLGDLAPAVAHVDHGEAGEAVEQLLAILRPHVDALAAIDDELLVGEPRMVLRLVRPEVLDGAAVDHGVLSLLAWRSAAVPSRSTAPVAGSTATPYHSRAAAIETYPRAMSRATSSGSRVKGSPYPPLPDTHMLTRSPWAIGWMAFEWRAWALSVPGFRMVAPSAPGRPPWRPGGANL